MKRAYTNGILLDGTEQMQPEAHKILLTEDDKIIAIVDEGVDLDGYEVIDLHGGYLCPGLINLHVHLAGNGKPSAKPRDNAALVRKILSNGLTRAVAYRLALQILTPAAGTMPLQADCWHRASLLPTRAFRCPGDTWRARWQLRPITMPKHLLSSKRPADRRWILSS